MSVSRQAFKLEVTGGEFDDCQILVGLGESGTGKSTFMRTLAGLLPPDEVEGVQRFSPDFVPSFKPQTNELGSQFTVRQLLEREHSVSDMHPQFVSDVIKPLQIDRLLDRKVDSLSSGETQRVAITLCLETPSAHLDSDMRIKAAMAIRRHVLRVERAAVIVEIDFLMAAYLVDQVILVEGTPSTKFATSSPYPRVTGLNLFLKTLNITFQRDRVSFRYAPRVNKLGSIEDKNQKAAGTYYDLR